MNNHQNAIFYPLDNFIKHSHSFAMTIFHKIWLYSVSLIIVIIITRDFCISRNDWQNDKFCRIGDFMKYPILQQLEANLYKGETHKINKKAIITLIQSSEP
jgi:hypothetical protein